MKYININGEIYKNYLYNNNPTYYYVNENGDIYSIKTNKYLSPAIDTSGRKSVCLTINGIAVSKTVHSMVVETHIDKIPKGMTVDHDNENFLDNHPENLSIITRSENIKKYLKNHPDAFDKKYSDELIHTICKELKSGTYYRDLVNKYNMPMMFMYNLVHCKTRKNIVEQYLPFPKSAYRVKNDRDEDIKLICELITSGCSNSEIYNSLNLDRNDANSKIISRCRNKLQISDPRYFDEEFKEKISDYIIRGYSNSQIISELSLDYDTRLSFLFTRLRKKLHIPDFNPNGVDTIIQQEICSLIKKGFSNDEILKTYSLTRNKYTINLLGKLRQKVKRKSSTTIENFNDRYTISIHDIEFVKSTLIDECDNCYNIIIE